MLAEREAKQGTHEAKQPRGAIEHKHDTLPWVIVAEHGSNAASSSDFP
jgi:hypothetical protein